MNTELRKLTKDHFHKNLFKLMNNAVFGKTMENIRKHRDIKLVTTDKKRNELVSDPNYHTMNYISKDLSIIEMNKTKVKMNKLIYLGLSILDISKILMYEFWYDYMKPKYGNRVKLCYMDTDSFIMNIKANDFYKDISNNVDERFDTSNYEVNSPLPTGKNKKVIGLMKDELGGKIITEFVTLRPKTYSYLTDDGKEDKKAKGTKKCVIKRMIKFNDYKNCLLKDKVLLKLQQRCISKKHDVYTEDINKVALSNNDDKRTVSSDKITSYPYGYKGKKNTLIILKTFKIFKMIKGSVGIIRSKIILKYKILNLDDIASNNKGSSERNDWPFRMLIIGPSGSGKTNTLLHLINNFHPIYKLYLYAKDTEEKKNQFVINKREQAGIKNLNDSHAFTEYSNDMNDVLDDINNYNKNRDKKVLIIFDDMIADIMRSEKFKAIVKELFIRCRKLNISIVFITQSYFRTPKDARLNSTHYILMKIGNYKKLKSIAEENSGHLNFKDFLKIYNYCTKEPYSFMLVDTRPTARVTFKKNFDEPIDLRHL